MAKLKYPQKKKKHTVLKIVIISILVLLIAPVALMYGFFFDSSTNDIDVRDDITLKEMGRNLVVDSLDTTEEDGLINIKLTTDVLDQFLYTATAKFRNKYIPKLYTEIKKDRYKFYADIRVPMFQTRACVTTTLGETEDLSAFYFKITDISLGRVGKLGDFTKSIVTKYITEESINQSLKDAKTHMVFDMDDMSITYKKIDLLNDIKGGEGAGEFEMYFDIMRSVIESDLLSITTKSNEYLSARVDLRNFNTNYNYVTDDANTQIRVTSSEVKNKVKNPIISLLRDGHIHHGENNITCLFTYLFSGYDAIKGNQAIVDEISSINLSSIGIDDYTAYDGFGLYDENANLLADMRASINVPSLVAGSLDLCELKETQINDFLSTKDIVGFSTVLDRQKEDGSHSVNFIAIDNFYCNLYRKDDEQIADFIAKINVNGYNTSLIFHTTVPTDGAEGTKIKFSIKDLYYGTFQTDAIKQSLFAIVRTALADSDGIAINPDDYSITFDFSSIIQEARNTVESEIESSTGFRPDLSNKFSGENITVGVEGADKNVDGLLKLRLINPIV